jgi:MFS family permease
MGKSRAAQRTTLFIAMVTNFVIPFSGSSLNIAIPFIGEEFRAAATSLSWIISAMMLTSIALSVPLGRFADLWGKRRLLNAGILVFSIGTLAGTFVPSLAFLIASRVIQGVGSAMIVATNMAILMDVFSAQERGRVLGLTVMCTYVGLSLGPVIGGFITHHFGWRIVFAATAAVSLIVFVVALVSRSKLPKKASPPAGSQTISPASILLYITAMFAFMYGFTVFAQHVYSYVLLGVGLVLFVLFARHEAKAASPVIEVRLFKRNRDYIFSNLAALFHYAATAALGYILAIYLEVAKGYQPDIAGLILVAQPIIMAIVSPIAGRLSDKWSPFKISSIGMAICALSMLSFVLVGQDSPLIHVIVNLMVVGFGFGVFSSPNTNAIMSCVSNRDFGVANSILGTMRGVGQVSSMAIITIVMHFTIGGALIEEAGAVGIMETFRVTLIVFAAICAVGVLFSFGRGNRAGSRTEPHAESDERTEGE